MKKMRNSLALFILKWTILVWIICFSHYNSLAQNHIRVNGKYIIGPCSDTLDLKGINYSPFNWGWSPQQLRIHELAKTKANAVRLVWYKTGAAGTPATTYANLTLLDSALAHCIRQKLIPILVLHDQTCKNDSVALLSMTTWFSQPLVLQLIAKYEHSLILNLANEALFVNWTGNPTTAKRIFRNTYKTVVNNLRNAGIAVPLMIDGPDCGTNLDVLAQEGPGLQSADPLHNLIFSAHAYWYSFANNDSTQMAAKINLALAANIPFVFGEVANQQDDVQNCQYNLNYKALLRICRAKNIGWLVWSWDNDFCPLRQISATGNYAQLSTYGKDLMSNPVYGMQTDSVKKSRYFLTGNCLTTIQNKQIEAPEFQIWPNPGFREFSISNHEKLRRIYISDAMGKSVDFQLNTDGKMELKNASSGCYFILLENKVNKITRLRLLLK